MIDQLELDQKIHLLYRLLIEGNGLKATQVYEKIRPDFCVQAQRWLDSVFGLFILSGELDLNNNQFLNELLNDDSKIAKQVLDAFCQNQQRDAIQLLLNKLPYDSAYKDFRLLVSSLLDIEDGVDSLKKLDLIDRTSPYTIISGLVRLAHNSPVSIVDSSVLTSPEQQFITTLQPKTSAVLSQQLSAQSSPQQLFDWLLGYQDTQEIDNYHALMRNLLVDYPVGIDAYQQQFGMLTTFDQCRIKALANERSGEWQKAVDLWHGCLKALDLESVSEPETVRQLILERVNQCVDQDGFLSPQDRAFELEQRLENNPEDEDACLLLIEQYRSTGETLALKRLLQQALDQFPEQPLIVATALEHATETVEFDLAAQLARNLLDDDVLNQDIRQLLILAYLSYADKLVLRGQRYAAQTLFDQTEALERPEPSGLVNLHRALMHYVSGDDLQAEQFVEKGCAQLNSYLIGYVQMAAETARLGFKTRYKKKYIKLIKSLASCQPNPDEIVTLMQLLTSYSIDSRVDVAELISATRPLLHRSATGDYTQEQLSFICSTLEQLSQYEDLYQFGLTQGQCSSQGNDELEYYRIVGITQADPGQISTEDSILLDQILDRLADKNPLLLDQINNFLNANLSSSSTDSVSVNEGLTAGLQQHPEMKVGELFSTVKRLFNR